MTKEQKVLIVYSAAITLAIVMGFLVGYGWR